MKSLSLILILLIFGYLAIGLALYIYQRKLIYVPENKHAHPADLGLVGVEEVVVKTNHTKRLIAWYAPAPPGRPTIIYFHGNGGSLEGRAARLDFLRQHGYGVLMTTYRGYSGSSGSPAEIPIKMDALYFYHWLQAKGVSEDKIVLYGESLGSGVAVATALNHKPAALVLEAPYSSIADVAAKRYPFLPVRWFLKDHYDSHKLIGQVTVPVLIIHGEADRIIPIAFGKKLFAAATQPKEAVWLQDAAHNDLYSHGAFELIDRFLQRHL